MRSNSPRTVRPVRWAAVVTLAASSLVVAGCSDDDDPNDSVPGTLATEDVIDQAPGVSNDVSNGSGEGGNPGDAPTGTALP